MMLEYGETKPHIVGSTPSSPTKGIQFSLSVKNKLKAKLTTLSITDVNHNKLCRIIIIAYEFFLGKLDKLELFRGAL